MPMSFEEILNKPASSFKPPEAFPVGEYICIVDGPPEQDKSSQKQTDLFRFKLKIMSIGNGVDAAKAAELQVVGKTLLYELYVTENAVWRLTEFLQHLGIDVGEEGDPNAMGLRQALSMAANQTVLVTLRHEISQDGKRTFHRVASTSRP